MQLLAHREGEDIWRSTHKVCNFQNDDSTISGVKKKTLKKRADAKKIENKRRTALNSSLTER